MAVVVEPGWQGGPAGLFAGVEPLVGPFVEQGSVESLRLAVGLGPVGPGPSVGDGRAEGVGEGVRAVAGSVVGEDLFDGDAAGGEEGVGAAPERGRGLLLLVGQALGVGQPGVVVQRGVQVEVADPGVSVRSALAGGGGAGVVLAGGPALSGARPRRGSGRVS
jgi:hypothetical protein